MKSQLWPIWTASWSVSPEMEGPLGPGPHAPLEALFLEGSACTALCLHQHGCLCHLQAPREHLADCPVWPLPGLACSPLVLRADRGSPPLSNALPQAPPVPHLLEKLDLKPGLLDRETQFAPSIDRHVESRALERESPSPQCVQPASRCRAGAGPGPGLSPSLLCSLWVPGGHSGDSAPLPLMATPHLVFVCRVLYISVWGNSRQVGSAPREQAANELQMSQPDSAWWLRVLKCSC